jgi:hypothetical protein
MIGSGKVIETRKYVADNVQNDRHETPTNIFPRDQTRLTEAYSH